MPAAPVGRLHPSNSLQRQFQAPPDCRVQHRKGRGWRRPPGCPKDGRRASSAAPSAAADELSVESLERADYGKFVKFLHLASPYVIGHRGRIFVIVLPGELIARKDQLSACLDDIMLLHSLGVRIVIVCGASTLIDAYLRERGRSLGMVGAYRVTDAEVMRGALAAASTTCTEIAAHLSKAPSIPMVRRHARGDGQVRFGPAVTVVSGNYVTAKRRGIINGVDFGLMGQVRYVQQAALQNQLAAGSVVLLNNIGVSPSGELLNCNVYDVAVHAAVNLRADKLLCLTGEDVRSLGLPHYLPLDDAVECITQSVCGSDPECVMSTLDVLGAPPSEDNELPASLPAGGSTAAKATSSGDAEMPDGNDALRANGNGLPSSSMAASSAGSPPSPSASLGEMSLDLDGWQAVGFPPAVVAAVVACRAGVNRAHLVDTDADGAVLLELYTRDGINGVCMIAADLYEGMRPAEPRDAAGVADLLGVLRDEGFDPGVGDDELPQRLADVTVLEREGKVLGCALVSDLGRAPDGVRVAELSGFIVHPAFRRAGLGDSLLDFVEQALRQRGFRRAVLVAGTGSLEWFAQRDFELVGSAQASPLLPADRAAALPPVAQLWAKPFLELDASVDAPAGKRIGF